MKPQFFIKDWRGYYWDGTQFVQAKDTARSFRSYNEVEPNVKKMTPHFRLVNSVHVYPE